jgi:hypothetical protein
MTLTQLINLKQLSLLNKFERKMVFTLEHKRFIIHTLVSKINYSLGLRDVTINLLLYIFGISFVCHQKPHSLQPNQIYGNLF